MMADGWNDLHQATGKDMLLHLPKHPTEHLMQSNDFFPVVLFGQWSANVLWEA